MGVKVKKKKKSIFLSKRRRERTRISFLFFLICLGLFGIFVIIEAFSEKFPNEDEDDVGKESNVVIYDYNAAEITLQPKNHILPLKVVGLNNSSKPKANLSRRKLSTMPIQSDWQPVSGSADKFYVYSAYYIAKPA
jgi:hypothetical protein